MIPGDRIEVEFVIREPGSIATGNWRPATVERVDHHQVIARFGDGTVLAIPRNGTLWSKP